MVVRGVKERKKKKKARRFALLCFRRCHEIWP